MTSLVLQPTSTAQWHALVNEAQVMCSLELGEELESYLVFLLMRFAGKPEMVGSILALEFLESMQRSGNLRLERLREVGDKCLLFAGLFPGLAKRRRLHVSYFVDIGQNAYYVLSGVSSSQLAKLYSQLCSQFVPMKEVLAAMREQQCMANIEQSLRDYCESIRRIMH